MWEVTWSDLARCRDRRNQKTGRSSDGVLSTRYQDEKKWHLVFQEWTPDQFFYSSSSPTPLWYSVNHLKLKTTVDLPDIEESQLIRVFVRGDDTEGWSEKMHSFIRTPYRIKSRSMLFFKYFLVRYLR
jgi:hypothetical protein